MLGADQFIEFIFTRDRNETWNEVFKGSTTEQSQAEVSFFLL